MPEWVSKFLAPHGPFISKRFDLPFLAPTPLMEIKVRAVCAKCNNEWLSENVEGPARPHLISLFEGHPCRLNRSAQQAVGTWIAKTSMFFRLTTPFPVKHRSEDFRYLREHCAPPPTMAIWIGAIGNIGGLVNGVEPVEVAMKSPALPRQQLPGHVGGIIWIGQLLMQTITCYGLRPARLPHPYAEIGALYRIAPAEKSQVAWPPLTWFTEESRGALAGHFTSLPPSKG